MHLITQLCSKLYKNSTVVYLIHVEVNFLTYVIELLALMCVYGQV